MMTCKAGIRVSCHTSGMMESALGLIDLVIALCERCGGKFDLQLLSKCGRA